MTGLARLLGGENAAARRRARYAITRAIDGEVLRGETGVRLLEQLVDVGLLEARPAKQLELAP